MQKQRIGNKASVSGQAARVDMGSTWERTSSLMDGGEGEREGGPRKVHLHCNVKSRSLLWSWKKKLIQDGCLSVEKSKLRKSQPRGNKRLIIIHDCFPHRVLFFFSKLFSLSFFFFVCFPWRSPCSTRCQSSWLEPLGDHCSDVLCWVKTQGGRWYPAPAGRRGHPSPPLWAALVTTHFLCRLF